MLKEDNRFLYAVIAGIIGAIAKDILSLLFKFMGIVNYFTWNVAADFFVDGKEIFGFWGHVVGGLTDLFLGSLIGVIFAMMIEVFGPKHYILKGIGLAWLVWGILVGFVLHLAKQLFTIIPYTALIYFLTLITHALFGIILSFAYIKLAKIKDND